MGGALGFKESGPVYARGSARERFNVLADIQRRQAIMNTTYGLCALFWQKEVLLLT